jgi:hypothetical protein
LKKLSMQNAAPTFSKAHAALFSIFKTAAFSTPE